MTTERIVVAVGVWVLWLVMVALIYRSERQRRALREVLRTTGHALEETRAEVFSLRLRNRRLQALVRSHKARDDVRKMINNLERAAARK